MKPLFYLIVICLTALVTFQSYALITPEQGTPDKPVDQSHKNIKSEGKEPEQGKDSLSPFTVFENNIIRRNLFKVQIDDNKGMKDASEPAKKPLEKTRLKLILLGTVARERDEDCWAVIEDQGKRNQDLYSVGAQIQGATIKSISRNQVVLTLNGKDQILEAQTKPSSSQKKTGLPKPHPFNKQTEEDVIPDPDDLLAKATIDNPESLIQSMKSRPYLKEGQAAGVLVYGIRPGTGLQRIGIKNGDIIRSVNGVETLSPEDLNGVAVDIDATSDITFSLLRQGKPRDLIYNGQDQSFTIKTAKE
ncbi:MAG: PDZ domain-containing protein [Desulfobacterales bacterium]|nr:PDZ domain-containing protein [Desulfobacterales bacterium]